MSEEKPQAIFGPHNQVFKKPEPDVNAENPPRQNELKPCPLCNEQLFRYSKENESASVAGRHPHGKCLLANMVVIYGQEDRWNQRAAPSVAPTEEVRALGWLISQRFLSQETNNALFAMVVGLYNRLKSAPSVAEGEQEICDSHLAGMVLSGETGCPICNRVERDSGLKEASEETTRVLQKAFKDVLVKWNTIICRIGCPKCSESEWCGDCDERRRGMESALSRLAELIFLSSHAPESESASSSPKSDAHEWEDRGEKPTRCKNCGIRLWHDRAEEPCSMALLSAPKPDKQLDADWIREAADLLHAISDAGYLSPKLTSDEQLYARLEQWCNHHRPPSYGIKPRLDAAKVGETPRTDAEARDGWSGDAECVSADFARQLERELAVIQNIDAAKVEEIAQALSQSGDDLIRDLLWLGEIKDHHIDSAKRKLRELFRPIITEALASVPCPKQEEKEKENLGEHGAT